MFNPVNPKEDLAGLEKKTLEYWKENKTFERSIQHRGEAPVFSFYDGPPFATGVPHYGTLLSSIAKDVVPRYQTMKGFRVDRRWGWDCHGLPAENYVEKKLGLKSKDEIETKIGIEGFNKACFDTVCQITGEWEEFVDRVGRWVDFRNAYRTMDKDYMESVWWAFKELYDKGLIYEDFRISLYCPRCETPLSNFEIAMDNSYEEITDNSLIVKFKIKEGDLEGAYLLAWTTTPWTLPGNFALAVGENIDYVLVEDKKGEKLIIAKDRSVELGEEMTLIKELKGISLDGLKYEPLWSGFTLTGGDPEKLYKVYSADFVSTADGTGIVHTAAFGEDDFNLAKKFNIPLIENVNSQAHFTEGPWKDKSIWEAGDLIVDDLKQRGLLFKEKPFTHQYPFCYRCHSKLIYKTQPAWYVDIQKLKPKLIDENEKINWQPKSLKHGRFLKGMEAAPDWNISRDRYWGTAMPIWRCSDCNKIKVIGSYDELYTLSGQKLDDYHRPYVDEVDFKCECGGIYKRIPQVLDCWFESGAMPFAERHYPFENKEDFTKKFPADYVVEYIAQTRAWFYIMHVLAVALFGRPAFKNVVATGVIAGEDGRKMSKSLGNYTDPREILDKFGGDALRFYLMSSPLMEAKNLSFSTKDLTDVKRGFLMTFWNSYSFFVTYALLDKYDHLRPRKIVKAYEPNLLDRWILAELQVLVEKFQEKMEGYEIARAARLLPDFVDKLSNWYIRRSRKRFWKSQNDEDKLEAYDTLYEVLTTLAKVAAPFVPFMAEEIYRNLTGEESVHLADFPEAKTKLIDKKLMEEMATLRSIVKLALALRAKNHLKVRQPLGCIYLSDETKFKNEELLEILKEELNVKNVMFAKKEELEKMNGVAVEKENDLLVGLDLAVTEELKTEGIARDLIRHIQELRKRADFAIDDHIEVYFQGFARVFSLFNNEIMRETLADSIAPLIAAKEADIEGEMEMEGQKLIIKLKRVKK